MGNWEKIIQCKHLRWGSSGDTVHTHWPPLHTASGSALCLFLQMLLSCPLNPTPPPRTPCPSHAWAVQTLQVSHLPPNYALHKRPTAHGPCPTPARLTPTSGSRLSLGIIGSWSQDGIHTLSFWPHIPVTCGPQAVSSPEATAIPTVRGSGLVLSYLQMPKPAARRLGSGAPAEGTGDAVMTGAC